jgi:mannose-6-phosphate isomerase-like protein (cupin superfamily)
MNNEGMMKDEDVPAFETKHLPEKYELAPDKSEIRPLLSMKGGGLAHCTLPAYGISLAVEHRTIEEIWYFIQGHGQVWRKQGEREEVVDVSPGTSVTIPLGTHFQFRNTGQDPLCFIIATMPPWPGEHEAIRVQDHWKVE